MVGWHYQLDWHLFEQALGAGAGQGRLMCCSPCGPKESDTTEWPNWTELNLPSPKFPWHYCLIYSAPSAYRSTSSCLIFWNSLLINWLKCHTHHSMCVQIHICMHTHTTPIIFHLNFLLDINSLSFTYLWSFCFSFLILIVLILFFVILNSNLYFYLTP